MDDKDKKIVIDGVEYIKKETALYDRAISKLITEIEDCTCYDATDVQNLSQAVANLISMAWQHQ